MNIATEVKVLVVDDHPIVRDGLRSSLLVAPGILLIDVCASGEEALEKIRTEIVDVLLTDLRMSPMSGLMLLKCAKSIRSTLQVLMFSSYEREEEIYQAYADGAAGYLSKNLSSEELVKAIFDVAKGQRLFSRQDLALIEERSQRKALTPRELEILEMLAKGLTNKEIGRALEISHLTARNMLKRACEKLDASDRTEATRIAIEKGIIVLE
ncbi:response regulator transcription factor [Edaphobacter sp. 12200R-103]|jgi:two-component system NarL family response regulator|uniref:response regulator transcription factor n=1 Tax=Edaphobacter sp. 12200R-103 TaxID=2703788 RepID=UPI00138BE945|nr:response regulator transcription factor [Edaphobacter sp. 12200R-103]QHS53109.1 response regulator transcription factor [Edaphobacter sp. 12200R-103]